jgi:hypothetical protein
MHIPFIASDMQALHERKKLQPICPCSISNIKGGYTPPHGKRNPSIMIDGDNLVTIPLNTCKKYLQEATCNFS